MLVCLRAYMRSRSINGLLSENTEFLLMIFIRMLMNNNESHDSTPAEVERSEYVQYAQRGL